MSKLLRIVPASDGPNAQGTRVFAGDQEIRVTSIKLMADVETMRWRAVIECEASIDGDIVAELVKDGS